MNAYTIRPARYAKGKLAVTCPSQDGYKTRAARLAEALARGRYINREHAYIMGPKTAARFERLYAEGWDANLFSYALESPAPAIIRRIDRALDAVMAMLARRTGLDLQSSDVNDYTMAWAKWPGLWSLYHALYRQRGEAQLLRTPR